MKKKDDNNNNLFDLFESPTLHSRNDWTPQAPPSLSGIHEIELDCETTGLRWWERDRPIGFAITLPTDHPDVCRTQYLPFGHKPGGNLDEAVVKEWARRELRGKHITNLNTRFDVHMMRAWGIDFEAQGCTVSDVGHHAALLDDHRKTFNLAGMVADLLDEDESKVTSVDGMSIDPTKFAEYHAGLIAERAEADVRQVFKLKRLMAPRLVSEDLMRVKALEDKVIYVVCEMEKNGALIDLDRLNEWTKRAKREFQRLVIELSDIVGKRIDPKKRTDQARIFRFLNLPIERTQGTEANPDGNDSFTDLILATYDHPSQPERVRSVVGKLRRALKLSSLDSKFLTKYQNAIDSKGVLRYALHQLRAQRDSLEPRAAGTVSGRFSSTELVKNEVGINIQQVIKSVKQRIAAGYDEKDSSHDDELFLIRDLFVPGSGQFLSADAQQIEYRIFASRTGSKKIIDAYEENPNLSFHKMMHEILKQRKPSLSYGQQKNLNFAKIYGAGLRKMAFMLGYINEAKFFDLMNQKPGVWKRDPALKEMFEVERIYAKEVPEVDPMLRGASIRAMSQCDWSCEKSGKVDCEQGALHVGYVTTILGRRMRFHNNTRTYKALNGEIQGSGADIMKQKLVELHESRDYTGLLMRFTVHDEVDGDAQQPYTAERVNEVLQRQSFPELAVPILWDVSTGKTWKECA